MLLLQVYICNMKLQIKEGDVYGNFSVLKELQPLRIPSGQTNRVFRVKCICGNTKDIRLLHLTRNRIKSCGCLVTKIQDRDERYKYIRKIWRAIRYRTSPTYCESKYYYDKKIQVCEEWANDFDVFYYWGIKNGLKKGTHIDRIDGNKNYSPENCRVVTPIVNANNKKDTTIVKYKGREIAFMLLIRELNLYNHHAAIMGRIKRGWDIDKAFDTPIRKGNYRRKF